jgi:hypothetical protein
LAELKVAPQHNSRWLHWPAECRKDCLCSSAFALLAVFGMLSAAAGAYYSLRSVVVMYCGKPKDPIELTGGCPLGLAVSLCVFLTLLFGLNSAPLSNRAHAAGRAALAHPQPDRASVD